MSLKPSRPSNIEPIIQAHPTTAAPKQPKKRPLWVTVKIVVALSLVAYICTMIRPDDLLRLWQQIDLPWFGMSAACFFLITLVIAWRYWLLIERRLPFRQTLGVVISQTVVGNLVASSAGAASYVALLSGRHNVPLRQSLVSLILARLADLVALGVTLAIATALTWEAAGTLRWPVLIILALLIALIAVVWGLLVYGAWLEQFLRACVTFLSLDRTRVGQFLLDVIGAVGRARGDIANLRRSTWIIFACSCLLSMLNLGFAYANLRAFDLHINLWVVLFVISLNQIFGLLPIQVFGGLGIVEVTMLHLYRQFGVSLEVLAPFLVSARLLTTVLLLSQLLYLPFQARVSQSIAARQHQ